MFCEVKSDHPLVQVERMGRTDEDGLPDNIMPLAIQIQRETDLLGGSSELMESEGVTVIGL